MYIYIYIYICIHTHKDLGDADDETPIETTAGRISLSVVIYHNNPIVVIIRVYVYSIYL